MIMQHPVAPGIADPNADRARKQFPAIPNHAVRNGHRHGFTGGGHGVVDARNPRQPFIAHADAARSEILQHTPNHGIRMAAALNVHGILRHLRHTAIVQHAMLGAIQDNGARDKIGRL